MTSEPKELRTIKKVSDITGASERFLNSLLEKGKLTRYKINTATYINIVEFYSIATPIKKKYENAI